MGSLKQRWHIPAQNNTVSRIRSAIFCPSLGVPTRTFSTRDSKCLGLLSCGRHTSALLPAHLAGVLSFVCFLAMLHSMWDLSSWTRDKTHIPGMEAQSLNHWITREFPAGSFFAPSFCSGKSISLNKEQSFRQAGMVNLSLIFQKLQGPARVRWGVTTSISWLGKGHGSVLSTSIHCAVPREGASSSCGGFCELPTVMRKARGGLCNCGSSTVPVTHAAVPRSRRNNSWPGSHVRNGDSFSICQSQGGPALAASSRCLDRNL